MLDYLNVPRPHILAHRGYASGGPENTLDAFQNALDAGATHIESDVHLTSDGVVVMWHDDTCDGVLIRKLKKAQLPAFVPELEDALSAFPQAKFNIDIKAKEAAVPTAELVRRYRATNRVLITSFNRRRRRKAALQIPGVAQSASSAEFAIALFAAHMRQGWLVRRALRHIDALQIPTRALGIKTLTPATIALYRSADVAIHVWTINEPELMKELWELGVDGIVTDETETAVLALRVH